MMTKLKNVSFVFLALLVSLGSIISFGKATDYYFWRDDTFTIWTARYQPQVPKQQKFARDRFLGTTLYSWFYSKVVGYNPASWQYSGLILKIINSLIVFFLIKELTKSRPLAFLAAFFYASFFGGLEVYTWARLVAFDMTVSLLAFIFYVKSYFENSRKLFVVAILISLFALSLELWRVIAILFIFPFWEFCFLLTRKPILKLKTSLVRIFVFLGISLFFTNFILGKTGNSSNNASYVSNYTRILFSGIRNGNLKYFESSLGNQIRSPIKPVNEEGGLSGGDKYSRPIGIAFLVVTAVLFIGFVTSRKKDLILPLVFSLWVILFYFPNWFYEQVLIVGASHRYIAISAVGVAVIVAYLVSKIKSSYQFLVFISLILLSLYNSNLIVNHDYLLRGKEVVKPLLDKLIYSIPPGETKSVIRLWGDHYLRGYVFDWSGPYLYAYLRGIARYEDLPIFVDYKTGASLMCDPTTQIVDRKNGGLMPAGETSSLDKVHGFYLNNYGILEDRTEEVKLEIAKSAACLEKSQFRQILPTLYIKTTTFINNLDGKGDGKTGLIINWLRPSTYSGNRYSFVLFLGNGVTQETLDIKPGIVDFDTGAKEVQTETIFNSVSTMPINFEVKVGACSGGCDITRTQSNLIALPL